MNADQRVESLGIVLPPETAPAGSYAIAVQSGNLLFISGKAPLAIDGKMPKGRLGSDYSAEEGYEIARSACVNLLATIRNALGSLDRVERIIEIHGSICTVAEFEDHAKVLDGASDLLLEIFGPSGLHARSVIGVFSLRHGIPLTLKATVEIKNTGIP